MQNERKKCTKCKKWNDISDFRTNVGRKYNLRSECKNCSKNYDKERYQNNSERFKEEYLRRKYNLSRGDYEEIYKSQKGVCDICKKIILSIFDEKYDRHKNGAFVDHNHETGKIRGLLCNDCNNGLGRFYDLPDILKNAIIYLEK